MDLHKFCIGIKFWTDADLYACLAQIDAQTDELYPLYYKEISHEERDESYIACIRDCIEDYELMNNIINHELENR